MMSFERQGFSDQLNIDTPEQVELHFSVAGIGSRFVAALVDSILLVAAYFVEGWVLYLISKNAPGTSGDLDTAGKWFLAILGFANFCLQWGYFALFEAYWNGQTPGKRLMKIRVIRDSGRQITFFEALARNLLRVVDLLPAGYLAGVITMLCNKPNKRIGDFVAGTIVVHERLDEQALLMQPATHFAQPIFSQPTAPESWREPAAPAMFAADAIARLGQQDLALIESFFARALDLTVEMRAQIGTRIAQQVTAKMGVMLPEGNPERALESIAFAMRNSGRSQW